ncbi:MAG: aminotransferase class V-fold PLP-dependent enzyme [Desulfobacteraceae bacterium]|nr:MAG: aminotransferase class V-fold PLP-dependent enzyme [Desulfobacteraceae bacterium]
MLNNYIKTFINQMARRTGIDLTDRHKRILEFVYLYYEKHRVGPMYRNIERYTGATQADLERLFPNGLNSVYTWVGIPIQSTDDLCKPIANVKVDGNRDVYLDHNATTYLRKEIVEVLQDYYGSKTGYGNPSSSTFLGKKTFDAIRTARKEVAECLKAETSEIIFTGSGSEANNMAVKGIGFKYIETKGHIITSQIEHPSIIEPVQFLGMLGFDITFLDPDRNGLITADAVKESLRSDTVLVAIMAVNNEIGTINPVAEIGEICRLAEVPFMVDAVQAFGKIDLFPKQMGITMMSLSGHKIYAPKGVGALYVDEKISLIPLIHGGSQEFNHRAGTENVGHIIALGKAAGLAYREMKSEMKRIEKIRDYFMDQLHTYCPDCILNGSLKHRTPTNLNIGFPGIDSGALLLSLNRIGIYVSAGSACSSGSKEASPVVKAIGVDTDRYGIIRFSFGLKTTQKDVDYLFAYLPGILNQIRHNG